jgi:hypothetical protein
MREELRLESKCKAKGCEALFVKWQHHVARHHSDHAFVDRLVHKLEQSPMRHDIRYFLPLLQEYKKRVAIVH